MGPIESTVYTNLQGRETIFDIPSAQETPNSQNNHIKQSKKYKNLLSAAEVLSCSRAERLEEEEEEEVTFPPEL